MPKDLYYNILKGLIDTVIFILPPPYSGPAPLSLNRVINYSHLTQPPSCLVPKVGH